MSKEQVGIFGCIGIIVLGLFLIIVPIQARKQEFTTVELFELRKKCETLGVATFSRTTACKSWECINPCNIILTEWRDHTAKGKIEGLRLFNACNRRQQGKPKLEPKPVEQPFLAPMSDAGAIFQTCTEAAKNNKGERVLCLDKKGQLLSVEIK